MCLHSHLKADPIKYQRPVSRSRCLCLCPPPPRCDELCKLGYVGRWEREIAGSISALREIWQNASCRNWAEPCAERHRGLREKEREQRANANEARFWTKRAVNPQGPPFWCFHPVIFWHGAILFWPWMCCISLFYISFIFLSFYSIS